MKKIDKAKVYNAEEGLQKLEKHIIKRFNKSLSDILQTGTPAERAGCFCLIAYEAPFYGVRSETFAGCQQLLNLVSTDGRGEEEEDAFAGWLSEEVRETLFKTFMCREALAPTNRLSETTINLHTSKVATALSLLHTETDLCNIVNKAMDVLQPEASLQLAKIITEVAGGRLEATESQSGRVAFELSCEELLEQEVINCLTDLNNFTYNLKARITAVEEFMKDYGLPPFILGKLEQELIAKAKSNDLWEKFVNTIIYYKETATSFEEKKHTLPLNLLSAFPLWENITVDRKDVQRHRNFIINNCWLKVEENFHYYLFSYGLTRDGERTERVHMFVRNIYNEDYNYNF